ncbi:MAG TPA: hypothetical protein VHO28_06735 [Ignavibacteriales bacterium]|nr:hypothetical protein [Ignavibacteriales bacterium]HEX3072609.1 hypothetical protein [Ignavibacteriales bacterium]
MSDLNITRRGFLAKAAALAAVPIVASALASCGDGGGESITSSHNSFDNELSAKETLSVKNYKKESSIDNLMQLPLTAFYEPSLQYGIYLVLRRTYSEGKFYIQFIQVNVVGSTGVTRTVEGLPSDAVILLNPKLVMDDLIRIDRMETKKRFKSISLYGGGAQ